MNNYLMMAICLPLVGCTSQWVQTRVDAEDYTVAQLDCETRVEQRFPVKNEVAHRTAYETRYEMCSKKEDCKGKRFRTAERPIIESYAIDVNEESRNDLFYQCMSNKGWENKVSWL